MQKTFVLPAYHKMDRQKNAGHGELTISGNQYIFESNSFIARLPSPHIPLSSFRAALFLQTFVRR